MSSRHLVFAGVVLAAGVVGYLLGASARDPGASRLRGPAEPAGRESGLTGLGKAVAVLRDEVAELRDRLSAAGDVNLPVGAGDDVWEERLRSREPTVVMDTVCRLRERLLAAAIRDEKKVEDVQQRLATGSLGGFENQDVARAAWKSTLDRCREAAEKARAASEALRDVRTLEDLARWRAAHGVYD